MIFGPSPKAETVPRYIYENKEEGFYNFYIENYKKYLFLTRLVLRISSSKITCLFRYNSFETVREVLFVGLMVYSQIVILRIALSWYIYINPYTFPWCF
jgi:hypothetical protein